MTVQGTIRGGMVVLDQPVDVPDGTRVSIFLPSTATRSPLSVEEEVARSKAALAKLLAIPDENPNDDFCAADHDRALYGDQQ